MNDKMKHTLYGGRNDHYNDVHLLVLEVYRNGVFHSTPPIPA